MQTEGGLDLVHDQPLEALHEDESECYQMVAIEAGGRGLLWDQGDGGDFEAHGNNSLTRGGVEAVRADICEFSCTV